MAALGRAEEQSSLLGDPVDAGRGLAADAERDEHSQQSREVAWRALGRRRQLSKWDVPGGKQVREVERDSRVQDGALPVSQDRIVELAHLTGRPCARRWLGSVRPAGRWVTR